MPFTYEAADSLRAELQGYDSDMQLLDGLTAADSLRLVINTNKEHESPRVQFNGQDYAQRLRNEDAQYPLFDIA